MCGVASIVISHKLLVLVQVEEFLWGQCFIVNFTLEDVLTFMTEIVYILYIIRNITYLG